MFPITVIKYSGRAGTAERGKDYHLVLITSNGDRNAMLIQRWAKAGQWGQEAKITTYRFTEPANTEYDRIWRQKFNREYSTKIIQEVVVCDDKESLIKALGTYWHKMHYENAKHLVPDVSIDDFPIGRRGGKRIDTPVEPEKPVASQSDRYADNPNYGSWA